MRKNQRKGTGHTYRNIRDQNFSLHTEICALGEVSDAVPKMKDSSPSMSSSWPTWIPFFRTDKMYDRATSTNGHQRVPTTKPSERSTVAPEPASKAARRSARDSRRYRYGHVSVMMSNSSVEAWPVGALRRWMPASSCSYHSKLSGCPF
jgi:hypothetical protein